MPSNCNEIVVPSLDKRLFESTRSERLARLILDLHQAIRIEEKSVLAGNRRLREHQIVFEAPAERKRKMIDTGTRNSTRVVPDVEAELRHGLENSEWLFAQRATACPHCTLADSTRSRSFPSPTLRVRSETRAIPRRLATRVCPDNPPVSDGSLSECGPRNMVHAVDEDQNVDSRLSGHSEISCPDVTCVCSLRGQRRETPGARNPKPMQWVYCSWCLDEAGKPGVLYSSERGMNGRERETIGHPPPNSSSSNRHK